MRVHIICLAALLIAPLSVRAQNARPGDELIVNGNFETPDQSGKRPAGWNIGGSAQWATDGKNHWIVEDAPQPTSISVSQRIPIGPDYWKLRLACRVRATDVKLGPEGWNNARIAMDFHGADDKMVGGWPNVLNYTSSTDGWITDERDYIVPVGATYLNLSCSIFTATGKVEWDDISLKLLKTRPIVEDATLPAGVIAQWDYASAQKWETPTRAKVCLNGLWRFHPVDLKTTDLPGAGTGWGYYKVPGSWAPDLSGMRPLGPDIWEDQMDLKRFDAAWYQREITIPAKWTGRRVLVDIDNPKQFARVYVDGKDAGKIDWPGGQVDITALVTPGQTHMLSIYINALPLEESEIRIAREDLIERVRAEVKYKGLCGDCYLESEPKAARVESVFLKPSVRKGGLGVACELSGLAPDQQYRLRAKISDSKGIVRQFDSPAFAGIDQKEFFGEWRDAKRWDIDQPNMYFASVELLDARGRALDATTPTTFGFREFWIQGRDFILNGKPIHLRCLDYSNAGRDFGQAAYAQVRETFRRARSLGFNYVIHSNYDYDTQDYSYLADTLRAGDNAGFPMSYTIRHVKREWNVFDDPEKRRDWDRIVNYEVRQVRNHPSVFMWAMDHNFLGWVDDQNPARMTGKYEPALGDDKGLDARRHAATLAEQFVIGLDGTRPCYHHQSGPFNQMITLNCYLNFTPMQDRIEWLSRWSNTGIKPLFFVEFGLPHEASWGGHRTGPFIWGNPVSSEPLVQEFGAIYYGDAAYDLPQSAIDQYNTIETVYARKQPFYLWDVLGWLRGWEKNYIELKTLHTAQTWPAFRTWGISAILPWDQEDLFKPVGRRADKLADLKTNWANLQREGISPDFLVDSDDWLTCLDFTKMQPTSLGAMFARVNRETLAYIGGPARRFTAKDHIFTPGETVEKQVICINDLRKDADFAYSWTATIGNRPAIKGSGTVKVAAGSKALVRFRFSVPAVTADTTGRIDLRVAAGGQWGDNLRDSFDFTVITPSPKLHPATGIAVYDPKGLTSSLLRSAGFDFQTVNGPIAPEGCRLLIIGREAVSMNNPGVDVAALTKRGVNVLFFEQSEDVLQRRWGFRTASPGTRRVFVRQPGNPVCKGITDELLRDWCGSSSLVDPYPEPVGFHGDYPTVTWCGSSNTRTWKWGNYGSIATVVIEKPAVGNFSSILDCEFDEQYTPLLEWQSSNGRVIFSQIDFSGRDMLEPAAQRLLSNLLTYAQTVPTHAPDHGCTLVGDADAMSLLGRLGANVGGPDVAVIAHGCEPGEAKTAVANAKTVVCVGLDSRTLAQVLPFEVRAEPRKAVVNPIGRPTTGALVGLGDCDFHWRAATVVDAIVQAPPEVPIAGNGIFAEGVVGGKRFVLMQSWPGMFDWQDKPQLKRTWRHSLAALSCVLTNCGVALNSPLPDHVAKPGPTALDLSGAWRFITDPQKALKAEDVIRADFDDAAWRDLHVPGGWLNQAPDLSNYTVGIAWYRKTFDLPAGIGEDIALQMGAVDDEDWTWVNGRLVGHIGQDTNPNDYWSAFRNYKMPPGLLHRGKNVIVVKVNNLRQDGGIMTAPVGLYEPGGRWLNAFYLDDPQSLDDPYRYNRW